MDITGNKYYYLTAVKRVKRPDHIKQGVFWEFLCDCGKSTVLNAASVTRKTRATKSCGCKTSEFLSKPRRKKGGASVEYNTNCAEYRAWAEIKARCYNKNHKSYKDYGGRQDVNITMDSLLINDFPLFLKTIGKKPGNEYSVDRIDNNKGYLIGNIRWATKKEQANNKRNNRLLTYKNQTKPLSVWAKEVGISRQGLRSRIDEYNWSIEKALTTPVS